MSNKLLSAELALQWIFAELIDAELQSEQIMLEKFQHAINSGTFDAHPVGQDIRTETNCPTCGSAVGVANGDGGSHYYVPLTRQPSPGHE